MNVENEIKATAEVYETFNWWQMLANLGVLVVLALMPYVAYVLQLIFT
jgi:hypothetical protein